MTDNQRDVCGEIPGTYPSRNIYCNKAYCVEIICSSCMFSAKAPKEDFEKWNSGGGQEEGYKLDTNSIAEYFLKTINPLKLTEAYSVSSSKIAHGVLHLFVDILIPHLANSHKAHCTYKFPERGTGEERFDLDAFIVEIEKYFNGVIEDQKSTLIVNPIAKKRYKE